jgi:hypothetical protein
MVRIKNVVSFFFVALYISFHVGTTLFTHTHTINGATIIHSHLHTDSHHNTNSGGHTEQIITLISQISHFEYIDFSFNCVPTPAQFPLYENKFIEITHSITSVHLKNLSLRAPPIV